MNLVWDKKFDEAGNKIAPLQVALPFQTIETLNESSQQRQKSIELFLNRRPNTEWRNRLIWGDKKYVLPSLLQEFANSIDLIYIDPPYDTGADFSYIARIPENEDEFSFTKLPSIIEQKAYRDTWGSGPTHIDSYLKWFYETIYFLERLLKPTGSMYVHLDWHVGQYAKVVLDQVFGINNFRNEIIRVKSNPKNYTSNQFGNIHDTILFYTKSDDYTWNKKFEERDEKQIAKDFPHIEDGTGRRYKTAPLHAPGIRYGPSGQSWKGMAPIPNHHWRYKPETLDELDAQGKIIRSSTGNPREKIYADESAGYAYQDIWTKFKDTSQSLYPTQKNEDLLDLIISVSSNPGDLVLDCFAGSGTTAVAAEKQERRWIVADLSRFSINTTRKRLLNVNDVKPFVIQNLGKYERQVWQQNEFGADASVRIRSYIGFILRTVWSSTFKWIHVDSRNQSEAICSRRFS